MSRKLDFQRDFPSRAKQCIEIFDLKEQIIVTYEMEKVAENQKINQVNGCENGYQRPKSLTKIVAD